VQVDTRGVPGVRQNALKFTTLADAQALNSRLGAIEAAGSATAGPGRPVVMVVGAGYAGVELAAVIAERLGGRAVVQIVTPGASILEGSPEGQRAAAEKVRLRGAGVFRV
jgi:NADH:ubiquinone reductase (non-electrogenic)